MKSLKIGLLLLMTSSFTFAGMNEARNFYKERKLDDAIREANDVLKQGPGNKEATYFLMNLYNEKKDTFNYLKMAKKYALYDGQITHEMAWNFANIAFNIKDYDTIIFFTKICNALKPNDHSTFNLMGVAYFYLNQYKPSVVSLKAAMALNPTQSIYAANLARSYERLEQWEKAEEYYKISLKYDPGFQRSAVSLKKVQAILQNTR